MSVKGYVSHISPALEARRKAASAPLPKRKVKISKPAPVPKGAKPQTSPLPRKRGQAPQIQNAAGGYVFKLPILDRLKRFLILGSDAGTYYAGPQKHTKMNAEMVKEALAQDYIEAIDLIKQVSVKNLAPKNDPAIVALGMAASHQRLDIRTQALAMFESVCRTGTHKLQFASAVNALRGWGPGLRHAIARYYESAPIPKLVYQMLKYQNREGFTQKDLLRLAHPNPERIIHRSHGKHLPAARKALFKYVVKGEVPKRYLKGLELIEGVEKVKKAKTAKQVAAITREYNLSREMLPTEHLSDPLVQEALLEQMPAHALIRNLANFTKSGLIAPLSRVAKEIVQKLGNDVWLQKSRVHPMALFLAARTYASGRGVRGSSVWNPVPQIVNALEEAFYKSFGNVKPTKKNILLAIDMSGSMAALTSDGISAVEMAAAQALVLMNSEPNLHAIGFNTEVIRNLYIHPKMSVVQVRNRITAGGGTDCSMPFQYASAEGLHVDAFVLLTDNETWAGQHGHPQQYFDQYRNVYNEDAKAIVISVTATPGTVVNPSDPAVLQVIGFDSSVMQVMNAFIGGEDEEQAGESEDKDLGDDD